MRVDGAVCTKHGLKDNTIINVVFEKKGEKILKYNSIIENQFKKSKKQGKNITIDLIQDIVSSYFNLRIEDLKSQRRTRNIAYPRQIAMYLSRTLLDESFERIGLEFGGKDHTTVMHSCNKIEEEVNSNNLELQKTIEKIKENIS